MNERQQSWMQMKFQRLEEQRKRKEEEELQQCTFKPNISKEQIKQEDNINSSNLSNRLSKGKGQSNYKDMLQQQLMKYQKKK